MTQIYTLLLAEFGLEEHPELPEEKVDAVGQGLAPTSLTQFLVSLGGPSRPRGSSLSREEFSSLTLSLAILPMVAIAQ